MRGILFGRSSGAWRGVTHWAWARFLFMRSSPLVGVRAYSVMLFTVTWLTKTAPPRGRL